jgi:hypothetical protein
MQFALIVVLSAGAFVVTPSSFAQYTLTASNVADAPVLEVTSVEPPDPILVPQSEPPLPGSAVPQAQPAINEAGAAIERYRTEIKSLSTRSHTFIHCKLKSGKVITGWIAAPGYEAFTLHTDASFTDGKYVYYKDLAESPRAVPAVGTQIKQGAQWTGIILFVVVFFVPLAMMGVIPDC